MRVQGNGKGYHGLISLPSFSILFIKFFDEIEDDELQILHFGIGVTWSSG